MLFFFPSESRLTGVICPPMTGRRPTPVQPDRPTVHEHGDHYGCGTTLRALTEAPQSEERPFFHSRPFSPAAGEVVHLSSGRQTARAGWRGGAIIPPR